MEVFSKPYEENEEFNARIAPFFWVEHEENFSLCLNASERYKRELFASRSKEGFRGNGYDWESLARIFLEERIPEFKETIDFDPETGMFCAYSSDADALAKFAVAFKDACDDDALIKDLFSRAKTDHFLDENNLENPDEELFPGLTMADALRQSQEMQKAIPGMIKELYASAFGENSHFPAGEGLDEELEGVRSQMLELLKHFNVKEDEEANEEETND